MLGRRDHNSRSLGRHADPGLGRFAATCIVIGVVIGTGVFLKARVMTCNVGTPGLVITVWVVAGAAVARRRADVRGALRADAARRRRDTCSYARHTGGCGAFSSGGCGSSSGAREAVPHWPRGSPSSSTCWPVARSRHMASRSTPAAPFLAFYGRARGRRRCRCRRHSDQLRRRIARRPNRVGAHFLEGCADRRCRHVRIAMGTRRLGTLCPVRCTGELRGRLPPRVGGWPGLVPP